MGSSPTEITKAGSSSSSKCAKYAKNPDGSLGKKKLVAILAGSICFLFFVVTFVYWFVKSMKQAIRMNRKFFFRIDFEESLTLQELDNTKNSDLPFFDLSSMVTATDNFSTTNKLGQGGFDSVYIRFGICGKMARLWRLLINL